MRILKNNRGMTLLEVIVACTLIALAALVALSAFGTTFTLIRRGSDIEKNANTIFSEMETVFSGNEPVTGATQTVSFSVGGTVYSAPGAYVQGILGSNPAVSLIGFSLD